jgi:hypothetical protein
LTIGFILAVFGASALVPHAWLQGLPLCYFKWVSTLDCPGCGLTRAFSFLFKGNLRDAIGMNAMGPVLALWLGIYALRDVYTLQSGRRPQWFSPGGNRLISGLFLFLFLGQWAWKTFLALAA